MKKAKNEDKIKSAFGVRVTPLIRGMAGFTNNKARGKVFGVADATISRWCSGIDVPPIATACAIADYFDVSVDWLLLGREPWNEKEKNNPVTLAQVYPGLDTGLLDKAHALISMLTPENVKAL